MDENREEVEAPISVYIPIVGHTFAPGSYPFLPMLDLEPGNKINFLPATVEESVY